MVEKLNDEQLSTALVNLNAEQDSPWTIEGGALLKRFEFENFVSAFGFITQVALLAQRMNHHPDWSNSYKIVEVRLSTHKCNGISELDFQLAKEIEKLAD